MKIAFTVILLVAVVMAQLPEEQLSINNFRNVSNGSMTLKDKFFNSYYNPRSNVMPINNFTNPWKQFNSSSSNSTSSWQKQQQRQVDYTEEQQAQWRMRHRQSGGNWSPEQREQWRNRRHPDRANWTEQQWKEHKEGRRERHRNQTISSEEFPMDVPAPDMPYGNDEGYDLTVSDRVEYRSDYYRPYYGHSLFCAVFSIIGVLSILICCCKKCKRRRCRTIKSNQAQVQAAQQSQIQQQQQHQLGAYQQHQLNQQNMPIAFPSANSQYMIVGVPNNQFQHYHPQPLIRQMNNNRVNNFVGNQMPQVVVPQIQQQPQQPREIEIEMNLNSSNSFKSQYPSLQDEDIPVGQRLVQSQHMQSCPQQQQQIPVGIAICPAYNYPPMRQ